MELVSILGKLGLHQNWLLSTVLLDVGISGVLAAFKIKYAIAEQSWISGVDAADLVFSHFVLHVARHLMDVVTAVMLFQLFAQVN